MILTVLGSGTIASDKKRTPAGYLLNQNNEYAMLDFGPGILKQLKQVSINSLGINTIFLSHFHLDHCADVFPFLLNRYLLDGKNKQHIQIIGPTGLFNWFNTQAGLQGNWLRMIIPDLVELSDVPVSWAGLEITAIENGHTDTSLAYFFNGKKTLFYSGDTGFNKAIIPFATGADIGLIECSYPDDGKQAGHLTPSETGQFATEAGIKKLVATHIYPSNDTPDLKARLAQYYSGKITIAEDFMELEF